MQPTYIYRAIVALEYYRDNQTGHDLIWERYDETFVL